MNILFMRKTTLLFCLLAAYAVSLLICIGDLSASVRQSNHSINLYPIEKMQPSGEYVIEVRDRDTWHKAGTVSCDRFYREQEIDIGKYAANGKKINIRITQKGGGAAHIDAVLLGNTSPESVTGTNEKRALKKIAKKDFDVIDAFEKNIGLTFPPQTKEQKLKLIARIEGTTISKIPFQFPRGNLRREMNEYSQFYRYKLNSSSKSIAGKPKGAHIPTGKPFFKEYSPTGTGHPSGFTYGWVTNDDKDLHVYLDFTPDNTMDGNKDYATVYAKTKKGLKAFKVSMAEQKWGRPEFTYTDRATYQHKAYRFSIPLTELGIYREKTENSEIQLAFAAYGTAGPGDYVGDIAYDSVNNRYLMVYVHIDNSFNYTIYGQLLDWDGSLFGSEIVILDADDYADSPSVDYDSTNQRFLVAWVDGRNSATTNHDIYGQLVSAGGSMYGGNFAISTAADYQVNPSVAYDSANQRFLVAWGDHRNSITTYTDIYGQLVSAGGSMYGGNFAICTAGSYQEWPSVAYDSANQRFLVAWSDYRNSTATDYDIYGQLVTAGGALYSGNFSICTAAENQYYPSIAYDSASQRFLVAWEDYQNYATATDVDIYGQLVTAGGSLYSGNFAISTAVDNQMVPSVVYDSANQMFLVAWYDYRNSASTESDIYGQMITAGGALYGGYFAICTAADQQMVPKVAYNIQKNNFLITYGVYAGGAYSIGWTVYPDDMIRRLVREYYLDILDREPDLGGWDYWTDEISRIRSLGIYVGEGFQAEARFFFNCQEYKDKSKTDEEFVTDLYQTFLQREPDPSGLKFWVGELSCLTRNMLITQFAYCDEFKQYITNLFGPDTTRPENNMVNDFYRGFLNRFPDAGGFNAWLEQMRQAQCKGARAVQELSYQLTLLFVNSAEYKDRKRNNVEYVEDLYNGILRRGADCDGFVAWVKNLDAGMSREEMLKLFTDSPEFQTRVDAVIGAGCILK